MRIKGLVDEDFLQYKKPSMFIATATCTFKCEKEANCPGMCQNSPLVNSPDIMIDDNKLVKRFLSNDISKAVVFGGLEPLDQFTELVELIKVFREHTACDIIIYTGYTEEERVDKVAILKQFNNIIIKFGRFVPNQHHHLDEILGIELASPNQYAKRIS